MNSLAQYFWGLWGLEDKIRSLEQEFNSKCGTFNHLDIQSASPYLA